ncbi:UNVERIFIED_CONTAM: hypothetical protein FKN15_023414 [Acipenser sinensis]
MVKHSKAQQKKPGESQVELHVTQPPGGTVPMPLTVKTRAQPRLRAEQTLGHLEHNQEAANTDTLHMHACLSISLLLYRMVKSELSALKQSTGSEFMVTLTSMRDATLENPA